MESGSWKSLLLAVYDQFGPLSFDIVRCMETIPYMGCTTLNFRWFDEGAPTGRFITSIMEFDFKVPEGDTRDDMEKYVIDTQNFESD
jgi:hypothetical protein